MPQLKDIPGEELTYVAATIAIALSKEFTIENLNILSNLLSATASSLAVIISQKAAQKNEIELGIR
jgi:hypothetical protein